VVLNQRRHSWCMPFRPVWLREQIVNEVDAAAVQKRECSIEVRELTRPGVSVNQVEPRAGLRFAHTYSL
jgi:hypothetical protein